MPTPRVPAAAEGAPNSEQRDAIRRLFLSVEPGAIMIAPPVDADPIFEAIRQHTICRILAASLADGAHDRSEVLERQGAAWERVCCTHPTTLDGLAALAGYVMRQAWPQGYSHEDGVPNALTSICCAAARFAYVEGGTTR